MSKRLLLVEVVGVMLLTLPVIGGSWLYQRLSLYRTAAATLPAELAAAKQEGLPLTAANRSTIEKRIKACYFIALETI